MSALGSGIYVISRIGCDKSYYIGSAANIERRWYLHQWNLRASKHHSRALQRAWDKYGEDAFEFAILESVADVADLIAREQAWFDRFKPRYNMCKVAGSTLGKKHTPETLAKLSAAKVGNKYCLGKVLPREVREKISASAMGRAGPKHSAEARAKMSAANLGRKHFLGRKHSEETRAKMAASRAQWWAEKRGTA